MHELYKQLWRLTLQNWVATPSRFTGLPSLLEHLATAESASSGPLTTSLYLETWRILLSEVKTTVLTPEILDKIAPFVHRLQPEIGSRSSYSNAQGTILLETLSRYNVARLVASWYQSAGQQAQNQLQPLEGENRAIVAKAIKLTDVVQLRSAIDTISKGRIISATPSWPRVVVVSGLHSRCTGISKLRCDTRPLAVRDLGDFPLASGPEI